MRLPLLTAEEREAELADVARLLDRALWAVPVSADAVGRKAERVAGLERWRDALTAQQDET